MNRSKTSVSIIWRTCKSIQILKEEHNRKQRIGTQEPHVKISHILHQQGRQSVPPQLRRHSHSRCPGCDQGWKKVLMGITLISFYKRKWELCKVIYERAPVQGPGVINFSTIIKQPSINSLSSLLVLTCQEPRGFHSKQRRPRQSEANATSPISTMMIIVERQRVWSNTNWETGATWEGNPYQTLTSSPWSECPIVIIKVIRKIMRKQACKLQAKLVRNYDPLSDLPTYCEV